MNAGGLRRRDEAPRLPHRLLPRLRDRRGVHPGRAVRVDRRGHEPRARHRDRLPAAPGADPDARARAAARPARRRDGGGAARRADLPGGRLSPARRRGGPRGALVLVLPRCIALGFGALGALIGLRTGSAEAVQGMFPLFFVLLFLSSMNLPRDLIATDWFRTIATYNPVSYLIEGMRCLIISGWDGERWLGLGFAILIAAVAVGGLGGAADAAGADMRRYVLAVRRSRAGAAHPLAQPGVLPPVVIFPLFFFTAFAGGLSPSATCPGSTSRPATRRSSSSSCCCSRRRSAASSPASGSRSTSRAGSAGGSCSAAPHRLAILVGLRARRARPGRRHLRAAVRRRADRRHAGRRRRARRRRG